MADGARAEVSSSHPSELAIFQLWQLYIENVDPLLKISHMPTLQPQLIEAAAHRPGVSKPLEALMFAIYLVAVNSLNDASAQSMFRESKPCLMARYHRATQQALINASFLKTTNLMVLQAFFLYLVRSCAKSSDVFSRSLL